MGRIPYSNLLLIAYAQMEHPAGNSQRILIIDESTSVVNLDPRYSERYTSLKVHRHMEREMFSEPTGWSLEDPFSTWEKQGRYWSRDYQLTAEQFHRASWTTLAARRLISLRAVPVFDPNQRPPIGSDNAPPSAIRTPKGSLVQHDDS